MSTEFPGAQIAANGGAPSDARGSTPSGAVPGPARLGVSPERPSLRLHQPADRGRVSPTSIATVLDMLPEAVFFCSPQLRIVDVNAAAIDGSGYRRAELQSMGLADLFSADACGRWDACIRQARRGDVPSNATPALLRSTNGDPLPVVVRFRLAADRQEPMLLVVAQPRDDSPDLDVVLSMDASRDYLTDLPTRSALEYRLLRAERRARRHGSRFAVLFVDVDQLKAVNDAHGHRAGDLVLRTLGERLAACVRPGDFVARYGGDEFVALVENVSTDDEIERIAQRLRAELSVTIDDGATRLRISASVGVAIGRRGSSAATVVERADHAMYRAKRHERRSSLPGVIARTTL